QWGGPAGVGQAHALHAAVAGVLLALDQTALEQAVDGAAHRRERDAERFGERLDRAAIALVVRLEYAQRLQLREREVELADLLERAHVGLAHQIARERVHVARERTAGGRRDGRN